MWMHCEFSAITLSDGASPQRFVVSKKGHHEGGRILLSVDSYFLLSLIRAITFSKRPCTLGRFS
jgi:hypothetical protein